MQIFLCTSLVCESKNCSVEWIALFCLLLLVHSFASFVHCLAILTNNMHKYIYSQIYVYTLRYDWLQKFIPFTLWPVEVLNDEYNSSSSLLMHKLLYYSAENGALRLFGISAKLWKVNSCRHISGYGGIKFILFLSNLKLFKFFGSTEIFYGNIWKFRKGRGCVFTVLNRFLMIIFSNFQYENSSIIFLITSLLVASIGTLFQYFTWVFRKIFHENNTAQLSGKQITVYAKSHTVDRSFPLRSRMLRPN